MSTHSAVRTRRRPSSRTIADAYKNRIVDAIRSEYPRLAAALGPQAFEALVADYLVQHPASRMTVAGTQLAEFLSTRQPAWVSELARLERAHVDVGEGPEPRRLARRELALRCVVTLIGAHALLDVTSMVDEPFVGAPARSPVARLVIVWRHPLGARSRGVTGDEVLALRAAARGATLADLCSVFWSATNPMARALDTVLRWIDDGIVAA